jgi:hypothetical protein
LDHASGYCDECDQASPCDASRAATQLAEEQAKVAVLVADLKDADRRLLQIGMGPGDWACVFCHEDSDMLMDGFECAYHAAVHRSADRDLSAAAKAFRAAEQAKGAEAYQLNRQANLDAIKDMFTPAELGAVMEAIRELDRQYGWSERFPLLAPSKEGK